MPGTLNDRRAKYTLTMYFAVGLIVFDIIYMLIHGGSITSPERESDVSQGTKFAFAMYIIAFLLKFPLLFLLFKAHVLLPESGDGNPSSPLPQTPGGPVSSPMSSSHYSSSTPYDASSPYGPAPRSVNSVATPSGVEMTMMGTPGSVGRPPPPPNYGNTHPPQPPGTT